MRITKRQLRNLIREAIEAPWSEDAVENLKQGDSVSAMNKVLNHYMMDDTWRTEEDALEDLLIDLGADPAPEDVETVSDEWLAGVHSGQWRPKTREKMEADWARGNKPRQR
jgi:hypothetical protein